MNKQCESDNGKYPTWKWLACGVIGILIWLIGFFMSGNIDQTKADAKEMRVKLEATCDRVTKLEMDIGYIKTGMERQNVLNERVDKVMNRVEKTLKASNGDK